MRSLASTRAVVSLLAVWLLWGCCGIADAGTAFTSPYILKPAPAMVASPAPRLEIRTLMGNKYQATLFIRALLDLQARPVKRLDSYTLMAGIHGSPTYFDGVLLGTAGNDGYCQHSKPFFAPWHRPYLMMLEQAIHEQANRLAAKYTTADKAKYVSAAKAIRLPYWDWGRAGGQVPAIFLQPNYTVTMPNGSKKVVRNPLNRYRIPADAVTKFQIEKGFESVLRSWTTPTATLDNINSLRSGLVSMFKTKTFSCFTDETATGCTNIGGLEGLHNEMHGTIGGDGHMSYLNYAAFDTIFFLHHVNVDRQLAIWEGIYPKAKMDNIASSRAYPFRSSNTTWWTTRDVMNVYDSSKKGSRRFGYYYPELADPKVTSAQLLAKVDQLYNDFIGKPRTIITLKTINSSPIDGTTTIKLVPSVTNPTTTSGPASSRRTRHQEVPAGAIPVFTPSSPLRRFVVKRVHVDVTDALAEIKEANPGVKKVDIVATITPFDSSDMPTYQIPDGQKVNLGVPIVSTVLDGHVVIPNTKQPRIKQPLAPITSDAKLLQTTAPVQAVVHP